ncbi:monothiol glutaredoxin-S1-like [Mangifera indica]|uniref:monothiol glutaredoxin-S1-like n=1 Tax=Mangifera indica TaxID=29780 RepID=UPI001CFA2C4A|nr:monothiol glutaredoxin-S1-like [Mangifera indica]
MANINGLIAEKPVVIFSRSSCSMSHAIKTLISSFGANPTIYELDEIANGRQIERELVQLGCQPSVPAVFIGQQLVGGAKQVMSLQVQNQLGQLLRRAGAIWV